jgi:hypothetical protein
MLRVCLYRLSGSGRGKDRRRPNARQGRHREGPLSGSKLAARLEDTGFLVAAPDMPWSRSRGFDKSHKDSMKEIDAAVEDLKSDGATRIVGGHKATPTKDAKKIIRWLKGL